MKQPTENKKNQTFNKIIFSFVVRFGSLFCRSKIPNDCFTKTKLPATFIWKQTEMNATHLPLSCVYTFRWLFHSSTYSFILYLSTFHFHLCLLVCLVVCLCAVVMYFSFTLNIHIGCCFGFGSCFCMCIRARSTCKCASFTATRHISSTQRFAAMKNKLLSNGLLFIVYVYILYENV